MAWTKRGREAEAVKTVDASSPGTALAPVSWVGAQTQLTSYLSVDMDFQAGCEQEAMGV